ncbi:MAG TPA: hypothetical protein VN600_14605 [Gemmatimonadaceae bacterium]|nr:hypothetical protein [Gemmatimonadaceae bacterium]
MRRIRADAVTRSGTDRFIGRLIDHFVVGEREPLDLAIAMRTPRIVAVSL